MLILTSEKVSHPFFQSFLADNLRQKDLVPKKTFSLYLLKLETQKVEFTQEQNHTVGANI